LLLSSVTMIGFNLRPPRGNKHSFMMFRAPCQAPQLTLGIRR
jgi:hypothetical protein